VRDRRIAALSRSAKNRPQRFLLSRIDPGIAVRRAGPAALAWRSCTSNESPGAGQQQHGAGRRIGNVFDAYLTPTGVC